MKNIFQTLLFTLALVLVHITIEDPRALALVAVVGLNTPRILRFGARHRQGFMLEIERVLTGILVLLLVGIVIGSIGLALALPFLVTSGIVKVVWVVALLATAHIVGTRVIGGERASTAFLRAFRAERELRQSPEVRSVERKPRVSQKRVRATVEKATAQARKAQTTNKTGRVLSQEPAAVRMRAMRERRRLAAQGA